MNALTYFLRLLFLVPIGFICACITAALMAALGIFGIDDSRYYSLAYFVSVVPMTAWIGAVAFFPALIAIVLAEAFSWRSALYYLLVGGAVGLVADQIADLYGSFDLAERQTVILLASGFVGGFTYWLIAGRLAGIRRPDVGSNVSAPAP